MGECSKYFGSILNMKSALPQEVNNMRYPLSIAILGASGYTGAELMRLLHTHPHARIAALVAHTQAGQPTVAVFPHLRGLNLPPMVGMDAVDWSGIDVAFCCLPHAASQKTIRDIPASVRVIDLSADFRLRDVNAYTHWYGEPHHAPDLQALAVYGLSEHYRDAVRSARLVANPGCYPTCTLLPLIPLLQAGIAEAEVIIDAKSGVSGAGRSVKQNFLFNEVAEGMQAYGVNQHRHMGELTQEISAFAGQAARVTFVPHLIPMRRGMSATIYGRLRGKATLADARKALQTAYANEPFVHVLPEGEVPSTHAVRASNHCHLNLFAGSNTESLILISVIDNLMKGASGQAVQNFNLMHGFPETLGLEGSAVFP
jgi:N-acetyl-gamma-glutamyl-phosphate reductase